ncbi:uncharacterized protein TNCT_329401 [Trichonephila clavata]|uniref:Uncharacterized protein n=1 Tax=Trichonephila clavata TaxID=2740835 RepID=A0A8X6HUA1_TRICU|nr:uncharacterized protein TNCT_329401 [Trichonephila clavata]
MSINPMQVVSNCQFCRIVPLFPEFGVQIFLLLGPGIWGFLEQNQSASLLVQFSTEKIIYLTDEERKDFDFIENLLDAAPINSIEKKYLKDSKQLVAFLDDIIQIKEDPKSLLKGVKALNVIGPCNVKLKRGKMKIQTVLDALYLKYQYASFLKLLKYRPTFSLTFSLFSAEIVTEFKINSQTGKIEYLHDFIIEKFDEMHYTIKGIWPFNRFATYALNFAAAHFKTSVKGWLEAQIRQHMNETLRSLERSSGTPEGSERFRMSRGKMSDDEISNIEELLTDTDETLVKIRETRPCWKKNKKGVRKVYAQQCILSPTFTRKADA